MGVRASQALHKGECICHSTAHINHIDVRGAASRYFVCPIYVRFGQSDSSSMLFAPIGYSPYAKEGRLYAEDATHLPQTTRRSGDKNISPFFAGLATSRSNTGLKSGDTHIVFSRRRTFAHYGTAT